MDLYHAGRQFDNEGVDVTAAAKSYKLFVMGYSPFSGYPFALTALRDPVLQVVASSYYSRLGGVHSAWQRLCASEDLGCGGGEGVELTEKAAVLLQYLLRGEGVGVIVRSRSRSKLVSSVFASSSEMAPLLEGELQALRVVQELITNPLFRSNVYDPAG